MVVADETQWEDSRSWWWIVAVGLVGLLWICRTAAGQTLSAQFATGLAFAACLITMLKPGWLASPRDLALSFGGFALIGLMLVAAMLTPFDSEHYRRHPCSAAGWIVIKALGLALAIWNIFALARSVRRIIPIVCVLYQIFLAFVALCLCAGVIDNAWL